MEKKIADLKRELLAVQSSPGSSSNISKEKAIQDEIELYLAMQAVYWRTRYKQEEVNDGDRNTRFFHQSVINRRSRNKISAIQLEDSSWTIDQSIISQEFVKYFSNMFKADPQNPADFSFLDSLHAISPENCTALNSIPDKDEILSVIKSMVPTRLLDQMAIQLFFTKRVGRSLVMRQANHRQYSDYPRDPSFNAVDINSIRGLRFEGRYVKSV
ncbi:uncharacterized protein LOC113308820 isoform X2 [Papaver somniferum]|uniref:uncharacterized protein LOC113308820 isoform X2 n=1 Tax=Papaver somniferum TaxID=3469 RepID=UPI000E6FB0C0|nr:uncharacterized protein LOC113308820 isoform X2 [Papaver somniferum]